MYIYIYIIYIHVIMAGQAGRYVASVGAALVIFVVLRVSLRRAVRVGRVVVKIFVFT